MTATLITILNLLIVGALCQSIIRFWRESRIGAESVRRLAALSSAVTLLLFLLIYSGEIRHNALLSLRYLGASAGLYEAVWHALTHFDDFFTRIANAINGALGAEEVGSRANPPAWPAVLLTVGYLIRFIIYRFHTRKGNTEAALSGAAYWNHITTFVMVLAFLIVVSGANPKVLVPASLAALAVIVVSVKLVVEDIGVGVRAVVKTLWTEISRAAGWIAYIATEIAGLVREFLAYASNAYLKHVREPLRRIAERVDDRNQKTREDTERRLQKQDARHAERFGSSTTSYDDEPPGR